MKNIILLIFALISIAVLSGCTHTPLQGETFEEVVIRNASGDMLSDVRLLFHKGEKNKSIQTNAVYPFSQVSLGFPPRTTKGPAVTLAWQQGGRTYSKDLGPYLSPVKDKKETYIFIVIVGNNGELQVTAEPVR